MSADYGCRIGKGTGRIAAWLGRGGRMMVSLKETGIAQEAHGKVSTISIDRPARRNALRLVEWQRLPELISEADRDPSIGVIVVRGADGHFSAGNDIGEFGALRGDRAAAERFGLAMATAMRSLEAAAKPVLIAIQGDCYGAAVALALAGDLRVASSDATLAITPAKLGALYLRSDLHRLAAAVGGGCARRLIYTARAVGAVEALEIGLVDIVLPAASYDEELELLIANVLAGSPYTLKHTKTLLRTCGPGEAPVETRDTLAPFIEATQGDDFAEGVAAFLDKRTPRFGSLRTPAEVDC